MSIERGIEKTTGKHNKVSEKEDTSRKINKNLVAAIRDTVGSSGTVFKGSNVAAEVRKERGGDVGKWPRRGVFLKKKEGLGRDAFNFAESATPNSP